MAEPSPPHPSETDTAVPSPDAPMPSKHGRPQTAPGRMTLTFTSASSPALTPTAEEPADLPASRWLSTASARTSFTRVDQTRAPTPVNEDESVESTPQTPQTALTFLLVSGRRRTMNFEPETTVGRVKELVWNTWPSDWSDERPPAPSHLRILHLGRVLQDDDTLTKYNIPSHTPSSAEPAPAPTIVHLSIRPFAPPDEEPKKRRRGAEGEDGAGGCCGCVVC